MQELWCVVQTFVQRERHNELRELTTPTSSTHRLLFQELSTFMTAKGVEIVQEELAWMDHIKY